MPRLARSSARCGPTPLSIRTSVCRPADIEAFIPSARTKPESRAVSSVEFTDLWPTLTARRRGPVSAVDGTSVTCVFCRAYETVVCVCGDGHVAHREALVAKAELSGSEKRALILWVPAGIVGLWYAQRHFFDAFPEASVNFKMTRSEALERANQFVESLGNRTAGYRRVIVFGVNDNAKTYLERQVGLKEANRLMASEVNVWNWNVRFFKPEQEEEFLVSISPEGNVTGYAHKVPEAQAG